MVGCSIRSCKSRSVKGGTTRFFSFPKIESVAKEWLRYCLPKTSIKNGRVCSKHFSECDFTTPLRCILMTCEPPKRVRTLKPDAIPTLHIDKANVSMEIDGAEEAIEIVETTDNKTNRHGILKTGTISTVESVYKKINKLMGTSDSEKTAIDDATEYVITVVPDVQNILECRVSPVDEVVSSAEIVEKSQDQTGGPSNINVKEDNMPVRSFDKRTITIPLAEYKILKRKAHDHDVILSGLKRIFTPGQINCLMKPKTSKHSARWSSEDITAAMALRNFTPKGYYYLRNKLHIPLPGKSTLRKWVPKFENIEDSQTTNKNIVQNVEPCRDVESNTEENLKDEIISGQEKFETLSDLSPVLTNELVSKALSDWFEEEVQFLHWENVGKTGTESDIMRIRIFGCDKDGDTKHVQVSLKIIPKNIYRRLTIRSDDFFQNEIAFYNTVLPGLLDFQSTKHLKEPFQSYVNVFLLYYDKTNAVICLEDAISQNFDILSHDNVGFKHCQVALKSLAQLHALSIAMKDQQPQQFDAIKNAVTETYFDNHLFEWYEKFWSDICNIVIDAVVKEFPNSIYEKKIKEFATPERYKDMIRAVKTHDTGVITHGDALIKNFMFKYENDEPVAAKIIEFQVTRYATPVLDFTFFIYSSINQDMRDNFYDDLLAYYYEVLSEQIRDLGSDPNKVYSKEKFMEEVKMYSYFGLGFSFESMPFDVFSDDVSLKLREEDYQIKNIADVWQLKPYKTKEARLRAAHNVVFCVDRGYI